MSKTKELSPRERKMLKLILRDKTYPEIAFLMGVSYETIKTYAQRVRAKLGIASKSGLAVWAARNL